LGLTASTSVEWKESKLRFHLSVDNALNEKYRDYLNRLRYFADEPGLNVTVGMNFSF
jgi:iron complex outermembrane receptor protein